ncbi:helix-turn-helix domain-containing protein [Halobacillus amylolyticus]|uniref:Helix-turn-helix domain-containing protein n=1 Tax=Halobacillus amylolyticus TaxID=2932259 RepID=A0ABY4H9P9_9BACI|nr:helix-turn-helix domain-containing protein [Halobacillus amylolyticus]UOR11527.1 helix-turn-helix domain-containing protein [Halobacillus amylolyticus]
MESEKRLMSLINSVRVLNSTRDLSEVLNQLIKEVHNVIGGANASVLFLYDKQLDMLYAKSAIGFDMEYMKHAYLRPGEGMSGRTFLLKRGKIFYSEDDTTHGMSNVSPETEHFYAKSLGRMEYPMSAICVPLISNDDCIGVLTVDIYSEDIQFDESDLQLLETFAGQAAIAIENATLFSQNERTKKIHEELSKVSLSKGGLSDITKSLAGLMGKHVMVFNEFNESLAISSPEAGPLADELSKSFGPLLETSITKQGFSSHRTSLFQKDHFIYFFPIKTEKQTLGLLTIITEDLSELDPLDRIAIEQAITIFAMEIDRQERLLAEDFSHSGSILEQLIHAPYDELSSNHLAKLNFPEHKSHHYVIAQLYIKNPLLAFEKISEKKQQLMRIIYREVSRLPYKTLVYDKNMEVTLMFTVSSSMDEEQVFQHLEKLFSKIIRTSNEKLALDNLAGFGQVVEKLKHVHLSYRDAKRCVQYLQSAYNGKSLLTYKQLGPYRLFLKFDRKELQEYVDEILGTIISYDHDHDTELLQTLRVYLESNQNMEKCSKELFVHVNTVKYRLKTIYGILHIEKLTGREAFELQLGLRILEYLNAKM